MRDVTVLVFCVLWFVFDVCHAIRNIYLFLNGGAMYQAGLAAAYILMVIWALHMIYKRVLRIKFKAV